MPAISIDKFVRERKTMKDRNLKASNQLIRDIGDVNVTPRLSQVCDDRVSFSCKIYAMNQGHMLRIKDKRPIRYETLTEQLLKERTSAEKELKTALAIASPNLLQKRNICRLECRLWVIKGVLELGLNEKKLDEIAFMHELIGTVPQNYFKPDLYKR